MPFRFKDLMIDVVGEETKFCGQLSIQPCVNFTGCPNFTCFHFTGCPNFSGCFHFTICPNFTQIVCGPTFNCGPTFQPCGGTVTPCGGSIVDPTTLVDNNLAQFSAADLQQLRAQLQTTLAKLDERERAQDAALRPQTRAQAEELESKLKDALQELQKQKKELK
jgi:hypothetical protein